MKFWQSILISNCITVLAVLAAIWLFSPHPPPDRTDEILKALNRQADGIQVKLSAIEGSISSQKKQAPLTTAHREPLDNSKAFTNLNQKLDMVLGKLAVLENKNTSTQAPRSLRRSSGPPMVPPQLPPSFSARGQNSAQSPIIWIDRLSDEKKREVEMIFDKHAARMRDNLPPPDPNGNLPDRETIARVVQESDLLLKQDLKAVLSEEEYQQFLDSHPEPGVPFSKLPAVQKNP